MRIFRFIGRNLPFFVVPLIGAGWGASVGWAVTGQLSAFEIILFQLAWIVATVSTVATSIYYRRAAAYQETLDDAISIIEQITGYREELIEEVAIYSKMAHSGVPASITNAIISLAQELKDSDTVVLVRVSHEEGAWYIRVAGQPVHLAQMLHIMDLIKERMRNSASEKGFIFKKEEGIVN